MKNGTGLGNNRMAALEFSDQLGGNRRTFLRVGGLLGASGLFGASNLRAATQLATGKSVIFLFLHGGPSQFETFDPKPLAPSEIRSVYGSCATSVPGVEYSANMPNLAQWAHRTSIVRSYQSGSSAHKLQPIVSTQTLQANMGSIVAKVLGANDPRTGMPTNVGLFPQAVDGELNGPIPNFGDFTSTGDLGLSTKPFLPGGDGKLQESMKLHLSRQRLEDRKQLLSTLDNARRALDDSQRLGLDSIQQQAFETIMGGVGKAFDLSDEDPKTLARYDTADFYLPDSWQDKNNRERYGHNAKSLGKLLLLARRLCEAGCTFVTVSTDFVWDMHADQNNLNVERGMEVVGRPFDHALSAYIEDVESRGLQDDILLVATGEMGRTPKLNPRGGRDHWGNLTPLLLHGGGTPGGCVIGQSASHGERPATTPITTDQLLGTVMETVLHGGDVRLQPGLSNNVLNATSGVSVIPGLR
ncbi:MAG: DUF1501 domain-containing protein [Pirellulaceae bacterium]|nr:DUF1501 domain-containing protein [Pirellulaceae bacterium]